MRFSPDKQPRRSRKPAPKEILDLGTPERDIYTFDPEIDIPESVWMSLETELGSSSSGIEAEDVMTLGLIADHFIVSPERVTSWRERVPESLARDLILLIHHAASPNYDIYLETLTKYSWLFPERKGDRLDLSSGLLQQVKALFRKEKIDLHDKEQALQHLKQLTKHWLENNHLSQMCSTILFLTNFFPDGNKKAREVLRQAHITPEDLVEDVSRWTNKNFRYGILEALVICFPETRELIRQNTTIMTELARVVRGGVELAGSNGNYAEALLAYDALTAETVEFNHTGIAIHRRSPKKFVSSKSLPQRPSI